MRIFFLLFLYIVVAQNINIENLNVIMSDNDSILNKFFSSVGIQYFEPYPTTYKTLPNINNNDNDMIMINFDEGYAMGSYHLELYDFLPNYPDKSIRKHFVDFLHQYTSQATKKKDVLYEYFIKSGMSNNKRKSIVLSFIAYHNICRITDYSTMSGSYISCKIATDGYYAYYNIEAWTRANTYPFDYCIRGDNTLYVLNETFYK